MAQITHYFSRSTGLKFCLGLALATVLFGCHTYDRVAGYPTPTQPTQIMVATKPISGWDLPIGTYQDEKRGIIVRGAQGDGAQFASFGLIGAIAVTAEHQAGKSSAESKLGASGNGSTADLVSVTKELLSEALAGQPAPGPPATQAAQLKLSPYAVFTVLSSGKACLHAMLGAEVPGPNGAPKWSTRYFARAPGEHPIEGVDGWMAQNRFADGIRVALRRAVQASVDDSRGTLPLSRKVTIKGQLPYLKDASVTVRMIIVQKNKDTDVARMIEPDASPLSGTHVLDRADFAITDAEFPDPRH